MSANNRNPCNTGTISGWIRHRLRGLRRRNQGVLPILQAQAQLAPGVCGDDGRRDRLVGDQLASIDAGNYKREEEEEEEDRTRSLSSVSLSFRPGRAGPYFRPVHMSQRV